jgi:hypothetical protein
MRTPIRGPIRDAGDLLRRLFQPVTRPEINFLHFAHCCRDIIVHHIIGNQCKRIWAMGSQKRNGRILIVGYFTNK